jgi:hypothetical protein
MRILSRLRQRLQLRGLVGRVRNGLLLAFVGGMAWVWISLTCRRVSAQSSVGDLGLIAFCCLGAAILIQLGVFTSELIEHHMTRPHQPESEPERLLPPVLNRPITLQAPSKVEHVDTPSVLTEPPQRPFR